MAKNLIGRLNGRAEVILDNKSRFTIRPEWRKVSRDYTLRDYPERGILVAYLPGAYEAEVAKKANKLSERPPYDAERLAIHSYEKVRIDSLGRILIDSLIIERLGFIPGMTLRLQASGNCIVITPKNKASKSRTKRKA